MTECSLLSHHITTASIYDETLITLTVSSSWHTTAVYVLVTMQSPDGPATLYQYNTKNIESALHMFVAEQQRKVLLVEKHLLNVNAPKVVISNNNAQLVHVNPFTFTE